MTAAARNTRKNIEIARNAARQSIPRNTSLILPSRSRSSSPSLTAHQAFALNRARYDSAIRSARAAAAHAARRESEQAIFGRSATAMERGYLRHLKSYIKNVLAPACKAQGLELMPVIDHAFGLVKPH